MLATQMENTFSSVSIGINRRAESRYLPVPTRSAKVLAPWLAHDTDPPLIGAELAGHPDPRHGGHLPFIVAMTVLPVLLTAALWSQVGIGLRVYFVSTLVCSLPCSLRSGN